MGDARDAAQATARTGSTGGTLVARAVSFALVVVVLVLPDSVVRRG